jgi:predicted amidohydrolase YtcJ
MNHSQEQRVADRVIRAGAIYPMTAPGKVLRSLAIRDGRIMAVGDGPSDLDALIGPTTCVLDRPSLTVLPGFIDTHTHFIFAGRAADDVPLQAARNMSELVAALRERASRTPKGEWIRSSAAWNEANLTEQRMPNRWDLDQATTDHPILLKRGGHNDVLNSAGMKLAGITRDTSTPAGGTIVKDEHGEPTGWLIDTAISIAEAIFPQPSQDARVEGLRRASIDYAAHGVTTVRDAFVTSEEMQLLTTARQRGALNVRVRAMLGLLFATGAGIRTAIDELAANPWPGDGTLRLWGLKFGLDGGAENGATEEPYEGRPDFRGQFLVEPNDLANALVCAMRRGFRVGTHAWGDRAVRAALDAYERAIAAVEGKYPGALVLEHAGLARPEQRLRAIRMGIPVTVQHPALHDLASLQIKGWGVARTSQIFPIRSWLEEGGDLSAGSDYPVGAYDTMESVWGMVTRSTRAGVLGVEQAIDTYTAIRLYTVDAARLLGESSDLGTLEAGKYADVVAFERDPLKCSHEELRGLRPTLTVVGGHAVHDPEGSFSSWMSRCHDGSHGHACCG